jgi:hypothetical protein
MYKQEFEIAVARTNKFNLKCPLVVYSQAKVLTSENMGKFPLALRNTIGDVGVEELVAQCISIHHRLSDVIAGIFDVPCYLTIGYVETTDGFMFHQSEDDLEKILKNGINGSSLNIHAWLTFPTMEIMDLSLPTSYAIMKNNDNGLGGVIAAHADDLIDGLKYHPMLVGEDFLRKSGALIEFGI